MTSLRADFARIRSFVVLGLFFASASFTTSRASEGPPRLHPGAFEVGVLGSAVFDEGSTDATISVRLAHFPLRAKGLFGIELGNDYARVRELDRWDLWGNVSWTPDWETSTSPFVGVLLGTRQEWVGSFRQGKTSFGVQFGARMFASERVAFRGEVRRVTLFDDPAPNFTETQLLLGLSIFFQNETR